MTIKTTSTARTYHPAHVRERQVRLALDGKWRWREIDSGLVPVREGTCVQADLPVAVALVASEGVGSRWVRWPQ